MRSAGPGRAHPIFLVMQPRAAFPELTISDMRLFSKRRTGRRIRLSTSRSYRSAALPGSSATAAQEYQVDGAISRTQLRLALADGLRRLPSQNLPDSRTRHLQIPADPDQPPLRRKWRSSPIIAKFDGCSNPRRGLTGTPARLTTNVSDPSSALKVLGRSRGHRGVFRLTSRTCRAC